MSLEIMSKLKQLMIFLLVVITIYSTLFFYLLMSVPADSRLQEIDYLQKSKFVGDRVLYMDKIMHLNDRFHYFTISLLRFRKAKPQHCKRQLPEKALLIVSASPFDMISLYGKLLRELEAENDECKMPEVFVFKRTRPLALTTQQNINKYAFQIGEIIKYITLQGKYDLSIFTHQQGAILTLAYLTRRVISDLFKSIINKIVSLVLVDLSHPFMRIQYDPPFKMLNKLKRQVFSNRQRVDIFNRLQMVIITTYKQDRSEWKFTFGSEQQQYAFSNTVLISSREMANVHYYLPPNSLSFPPLVRRIGHFFSKSFSQNMTITDIHNFFRHGQSYSHEIIQQHDIQNCVQNSYTQEHFVSNSPCIKLNTIELNDSQIMLIYSPNHFQMYSSDFKKLYPFDNLTEGSVYVLEQMKRCAYIINPELIDIYVAVRSIVSPQNPLQIPESQIFAASQLIFSNNYSIVNICPNMHLLFPLHFAQGDRQRKFLVENNGQCFIEDSFLEQFSSQLFMHWSLVRNLIIFTLLSSEYRKQRLSQRLTEQFFINILLIIWRDQIKSKLLYSLYIVSFGLLVQYAAKGIIYITSKISIQKKYGNKPILIISGICFIGLVLNWFNIWGLFLFSTICFINQDNLTMMLIKIYFLKDDILHNSTNGLTELVLLTMWLYTTSPPYKNPSTAFWTPQRVFTGLLLLGMALSVDSSGQFVDNIITIFMKVLIIVKTYRMCRK